METNSNTDQAIRTLQETLLRGDHELSSHLARFVLTLVDEVSSNPKIYGRDEVTTSSAVASFQSKLYHTKKARLETVGLDKSLTRLYDLDPTTFVLEYMLETNSYLGIIIEFNHKVVAAGLVRKGGAILRRGFDPTLLEDD